MTYHTGVLCLQVTLHLKDAHSDAELPLLTCCDPYVSTATHHTLVSFINHVIPYRGGGILLGKSDHYLCITLPSGEELVML